MRKNRGLTQEKLADKANLSIQFLGDVERGKANPTLESLDKIASALDIGMHDLFDMDEFQTDTDKLRKRMADYVQSADIETLQRLDALIRLIS